MPEREQLGQAGVFIGATLIGLLLLVVLPRQCREAESGDRSGPQATAPAPDPIGPRLKKNASGFGSGTAAGASSASAPQQRGFVDEAVRLAQLPVDESDEALEELFSRWAAVDAPGASVWLENLPVGDFREAAAAALCQNWALSDPLAASAWVFKHLGSGSFRAATGALVSQWCQLDPESTAQWVATVPGAEDRAAAESGLAQTWAEKDPAAATEWLKKLPPEAQGPAVQSLVTGWAGNDPAAAATWLQAAVAENPSLPPQTAGILVSAWADKDAGAVSRWLNSLPEGPFYEAAATSFSQAAAENSPKDALLWARSLENPAGREHAVVFAMEKWYDSDKDSFLKALPGELSATKDKALQKAVYEMLYRKDPSFRESLLDLATSPPEKPDGE